jgi:hypothetical protein
MSNIYFMPQYSTMGEALSIDRLAPLAYFDEYAAADSHPYSATIAAHRNP